MMDPGHVCMGVCNDLMRSSKLRRAHALCLLPVLLLVLLLVPCPSSPHVCQSGATDTSCWNIDIP
jgi:hypothetical protein